VPYNRHTWTGKFFSAPALSAGAVSPGQSIALVGLLLRRVNAFFVTRRFVWRPVLEPATAEEHYEPSDISTRVMPQDIRATGRFETCSRSRFQRRKGRKVSLHRSYRSAKYLAKVLAIIRFVTRDTQHVHRDGAPRTRFPRGRNGFSGEYPRQVPVEPITGIEEPCESGLGFIFAVILNVKNWLMLIIPILRLREPTVPCLLRRS